MLYLKGQELLKSLKGVGVVVQIDLFKMFIFFIIFVIIGCNVVAGILIVDCIFCVVVGVVVFNLDEYFGVEFVQVLV